MNIETFFEQLACTAHHKVNLDKLLNENTSFQQIVTNNDISLLKSLLNEKAISADRNTIADF